MKVARLSGQRTGSLYSKETSMVLVSVRGWADPRDTVQPEGLSQWRIPLTPSWIKLPTFQLVMQSFNQLRHCIPHPPKRMVLRYPPWEYQILQLIDFSSSLISFFTDSQAIRWVVVLSHRYVHFECVHEMNTKWHSVWRCCNGHMNTSSYTSPVSQFVIIWLYPSLCYTTTVHVIMLYSDCWVCNTSLQLQPRWEF